MGQDFGNVETALMAHGRDAPAVRFLPRVEWTDRRGARAATLEGCTRVGSASAAELVIDDPTVSRLHAEFELQDDGVWVRDLASRNGTYVEEVRVLAARVPEGGRIRLGSTTLRLRTATQPTEVERWPSEQFGPLIARSVAMGELFARLARFAQSDAPVLIQGETGTGKELVARALHEAGPRAGGPLVVVDCGALPEALLEAELFGHARGAFTGAATERMGSIEAAQGGTVFLDEVGELPLAMQPRLLRAVESRTVRRIGETKYRPLDVRFVSATHRDLGKMVNAGAFREDLYFRLAVLPVLVPPLRARVEDIVLLLAHFVGPSAPPFDDAVVKELRARPWLGNVRELRNFAERVLAVGVGDALAMTRPSGTTDDAPRGLAAPTTPQPGAPGVAGPSPESIPIEQPFRDLRDRYHEAFERAYLTALLRHCHNDVALAAQTASIERSYLYKLIRRHGM